MFSSRSMRPVCLSTSSIRRASLSSMSTPRPSGLKRMKIHLPLYAMKRSSYRISSSRLSYPECACSSVSTHSSVLDQLPVVDAPKVRTALSRIQRLVVDKAGRFLVKRVLHENLFCVLVDHLAPRVRREDALEARRAVPVVLSVAAPRVGPGRAVGAPLSASVTFTKAGRACRAVCAALMRAPLSAAMNTAILGCAERALTAALLMRAPLSASVNNTKIGCALRALVAALLMRAPLSASVDFAIFGCALRALTAALMRAPLSATVTNTHAGCTERAVWLTSRMRAHAVLPFTSGPGARDVALRRITIRLHTGKAVPYPNDGEKKGP